MNRKNSIDLLRVLGAVTVVILHVVKAPVTNYQGVLPEHLRVNLNVVEILLGWVVPVFLMITGYCLAIKRECTYDYCFGHVKKFVLVLFTIGLFFALLEEGFSAMQSGTFPLAFSVWKRALLNVINRNLWDHMWFVYMIIGVYLVMPVIHKFMSTDEKNCIILTTLLFIFSIVLPEVNKSLGTTINIDFPFGGYLFYVCFGSMIRKCGVSKKFYYIAVVCGIISAVYMLASNAGIGRLNDRSPYVAILAVCVFVVISELDIKGSKILYEISGCTWGIYLIHPIFLNVALKLFKLDLLSSLPYVKLPIACVIVFLLSLGTVYILKRTPLIKNIL